MTKTQQSDEANGLRGALWAIAGTGVVFSIATPFVLGRGAVLGVVVGSGIAVFNLWALGRIVRAFMNGAGLPWVLLAALKLVGLLAIIGLVLRFEIAAVVPLAIGYASLPLGIVLAQLGAARPPVATAPHIQGGITEDSSHEGR
jgi:hypothetical protein